MHDNRGQRFERLVAHARLLREHDFPRDDAYKSTAIVNEASQFPLTQPEVQAAVDVEYGRVSLDPHPFPKTAPARTFDVAMSIAEANDKDDQLFRLDMMKTADGSVVVVLPNHTAKSLRTILTLVVADDNYPTWMAGWEILKCFRWAQQLDALLESGKEV
jgi:hypothetical protein